LSDFLIDKAFEIVSALIALGAIFLTLKEKKRKVLSYDVLSSTSLIMRDDALSKRLTILFDNDEIKEDVHLVLVKIQNTGNVPIELTDFSEKLSIDTSGTILVAEVKETTPSNLSVKIDEELLTLFGMLNIDPLLLNSKDTIILKLLITSYKNDLTVSTRISGVEEVTKIKEKGSISSNWIAAFMLFFMVVTMGVGIFSLSGLDWQMGWISPTTLGMTVVYVFCISLIRYFKR
jgi:hypothetical protein